METFIMQHLQEIGPWLYLIVVFFLLFEGEVVLFLSVYLAHQGYLNIYLLLAVAFTAAFGADCLWYEFGGRISATKRLGRHLAKIARPVDGFLTKHPAKTIFISKFTYGLNRATLVRVRAAGVTFKKFLKIELVTIICWMSLITGLAIGASNAFAEMKRNMKYAEIGLLIAVLLFMLVSRIIANISRRTMDAPGKI